MQDEFVIFVHKSSIQEMSFSADFEEENLDLELRKVHLVKLKKTKEKRGLFWSKIQPTFRVTSQCKVKFCATSGGP